MALSPRLLCRSRRPIGRTIYYTGLGEETWNWSDLNNWSTTPEGYTPISSLPGPQDTVILENAYIDAGPPTITIKNLIATNINLNISLTVLGNAIFNGNTANFASTINGNVTFNDTSYNAFEIIGNVIFNDFTGNEGTIDGDAIFNDNSFNYYGTIVNNAMFNHTSQNIGGYVLGIATFTGNSCNNNGIAGTFVPNPPPAC